MLDILRANTRSVLTYVLFGIIILIFVVSFGPGSRGCTSGAVGGASYAARVNGTTITAADFERRYAQRFRQYQQSSGGAFTRELADQLGLRSTVMQELVNLALVQQESEKHGITVSDDDLSREIKSDPRFQTDGRFDYDLYERAAIDIAGSKARYEERLRQDLATMKMLAALKETVKVSDDEVRTAWLADSDKANVTFVKVPVSAAKSELKVTDADVNAYLAANRARVEQFYKENAARFEKRKRVHARHILVKADEKAPKDVDAAARGKIEALAARAAMGEDFAKLAQEASDDPGSKDRGGDLGFFGPGVMAPQFEAAAFALPAGKISEPVRTRFGWHLIKAEAVQEPETTPFDKAAPEIARELAGDDAARTLARKRAQEALAKAEAGRSLADLFPAAPTGANAKPNKPLVTFGGQTVSAEETGSFALGSEIVPKLGKVPGLVADLEQAQSGQVLRKVYDAPDAEVVAVVKERQRPDPSRFAEKKDELTTRLRNRKEAQIESSWLKELRERAQVSVNEAFVQGGALAPSNVEAD